MTDQPLTNEEAKVLGKLVKNMTKPQVDYILKQVRARYAELRSEQELQVLEAARPGKTVRFTSIKPKYLTGVCATILAILPEGKLEVEMINPPTRAVQRFSRIVKVHATSCTVID